MDASKEYWDKRPCNIRHSTKPTSTKEYFEEVSQKKYLVEPHIPKFANFAEWKGKRVLELGCGIGTDAQSFVEAGADYTGIDFSENSIELAKKRFELFGLYGIFIKGDLHNFTDYISGHFDLIYSFGVIHHCENPSKVISEIYKIADATTTIRIMLYSTPSWKKDIALQQPEAQENCPIVYFYTKNNIKELFKGFDILSIEREHIFPYKIEDYKNGKYIKEDWFNNMPSSMFRRLEKQLGHHWLIEAKVKYVKTCYINLS